MGALCDCSGIARFRCRAILGGYKRNRFLIIDSTRWEEPRRDQVLCVVNFSLKRGENKAENPYRVIGFWSRDVGKLEGSSKRMGVILEMY
jgi:hypothetical protein